MGDFNLVRLQQLWSDYATNLDDHHQWNLMQTVKNVPVVELLQSVKLARFENDRSHFHQYEMNTHCNNFRFSFEFTVSINNGILPLRCIIDNTFDFYARIPTKELISAYLTHSPTLQLSIIKNGKDLIYEQRAQNPLSSKATFFADQIQHFQECLKLESMSRNQFETFVHLIFKWATTKKVCRFRINHLKTTKQRSPPSSTSNTTEGTMCSDGLAVNLPAIPMKSAHIQTSNQRNIHNTNVPVWHRAHCNQHAVAQHRKYQPVHHRHQAQKRPAYTTDLGTNDHVHTTQRHIDNGNPFRDSQPKHQLDEQKQAPHQLQHAHTQTAAPYAEVNMLFYASMDRCKYKIVDIVDVSQSENASIYEKILEEKCKSHGKTRDRMEGYVWHGSYDIDNLHLIIKNGFDRSYNNRGRYGKGTYFARDAAYCNQGFCGMDKSGTIYVLLCKIIIGDYTEGNCNMDKIPRKENGKEYDTLVDSKRNPSIFVVWRDYHAVPWYLVKYVKVRRNPNVFRV